MKITIEYTEGREDLERAVLNMMDTNTVGVDQLEQQGYSREDIWLVVENIDEEWGKIWEK